MEKARKAYRTETAQTTPTDMTVPIYLHTGTLRCDVGDEGVTIFVPAHSVDHRALDALVASVYPNDRARANALGEKLYDTIVRHTAEAAVVALIRSDYPGSRQLAPLGK